MKRIFVIIVLIVCTGLFGLWAERRKVVIGGDAEYAPYEFINSTGMPDGYNVELSRELAKVLDWDVEFRLGKWALVMDWLQNSEIDLVQGMAFSMQRAKTFHFSTAHSVTWRSIFVRKDSSILSEADILDKSVVIQQDDVAKEYLEQIGFTGKLNHVPSQDIAIRLLNKGDYDACVANYTLGMYTIQEGKLKNIRVLPYRIHQREYCFASLNPEIIKQVDEALLQLNMDGTLNTLHQKWFAQNITNLPIHLSMVSIILLVCIPLIILSAVMVILLRRKRTQLKLKDAQFSALETALRNTQAEFIQWQNEFTAGPIVIYKCKVEPYEIIYISDNVEKWGFTAQELKELSTGFTELIFSEDRERILDESMALSLGKTTTLYYRVQSKSQGLCWVLDYCSMLLNPETNETCLYGYLLDITEQKNLEAQLLEEKERAEAASIAKSHFLANMSHEIRTPLNGITGFLQVLLQMDSPPELREIYDIMYSSGQNLLKTINDILDFSKIESGKMELMISNFNLRYLVEDVVKQFEYQNKRKGLVMSFYIEEGIPDVLKGDQLRLKQILINLMQNAIKFTEQGKIEIKAEIYTSSENDIRLLFKVIDTGIGINQTKQQDIFDNYTQADKGIASKYGGTGLGLAIVKRLVELMHGFVWVESEPQKGSCFFFILPFALHKEVSSSIPEQKHAAIHCDNCLHGRVLLAEDEPINQLVTKRQVEAWGLKVDIAQNGVEALKMHQQKPYDLILMDIQMPLMDGITATQKIRDLELTTNKHTPIIAFTAAALLGDRERFLAVGMDAYIAKPIDIYELYNLICGLLELR
ncbi:MAG: transporter substrate-binding domain-containing protein [Candidatus Cloacimonetes bacterium]|jgi:signal transduction histidine kinase|nr:transporter substrate-binding domain-containing protein [Candidatus Cloacimonadota bacterium]MDY0298658.1 transporter substrate-binding domain-containing protein [Candidatus Cloacimonadaceae bacterium]